MKSFRNFLIVLFICFFPLFGMAKGYFLIKKRPPKVDVSEICKKYTQAEASASVALLREKYPNESLFFNREAVRSW